MNMDKENLERNLYICYEDNGFECTNFQHARGYLFALGEGEFADWEGYKNATEEDLLEAIKEMGFKRCEEDTSKCLKWKLTDNPVCFRRECQGCTPRHRRRKK